MPGVGFAGRARRAAVLAGVAFTVTIVPFGRRPTAPAAPAGTSGPRSGLDSPAAGERLLYDVLFMGMRAGTLELAVVGEGVGDRATCSVVEMRITSTHVLLEGLFPVRDTVRSWVDREGLFSRGYELTRRHGNTELVDAQRFDYERGVAPWSRVEDGRVKTGEVELPGPVQDSVSWVYYARSRIAAGERELRFTLIERDKVRPADLSITGQEEIDLGPLGRVRALRASGSVGFGALGGRDEDSGVDQEDSLLWFDPATGILVKARVAAKVGTMGLLLRGAENAPPVGRQP